MFDSEEVRAFWKPSSELFAAKSAQASQYKMDAA